VTLLKQLRYLAGAKARAVQHYKPEAHVEKEEFTYIDENIKVMHGGQAHRALSSRSDAIYIGDAGGIHSVDRDRWLEAQRCEYRHWFNNEARVSDDHNFQNMRYFANYQALSGMRFQRAIELGCGPFTNARFVSQGCRIEFLDLLDPLIGDYLKHRNRYYDNGKLLVAPKIRRYDRIHRRFPWLWWSAAPVLRKTVQIGRLIQSSIESFELSGRQYDLVIIINVLEHCYDLGRIFDQIQSMLTPIGVLVFGDIGFDAEELSRIGTRQWDAAHPLRPLKTTIGDFLGRFEPLLDNSRSVTAGVYEKCTFRSFIGRRRNVAEA
jgi:SAM-dependent methyltransferase